MDIQLFVGREEPKQENMNPIQNDVYEPLKPHGGIWTSTFVGEEYGSDWLQFALSIRREKNPIQAWKLYPRADTRLYVVDTYEDLERLMESYRLDSLLLQEMPPFMRTNSLLVGIDYEKLAEKYDGLHLTYRGQQKTRNNFSVRMENGRLETETKTYTLYGFDVESTIYFRWCFEKVEQVTTQTFKPAR